jgi:hypothetical protein
VNPTDLLSLYLKLFSWICFKFANPYALPQVPFFPCCTKVQKNETHVNFLSILCVCLCYFARVLMILYFIILTVLWTLSTVPLFQSKISIFWKITLSFSSGLMPSWIVHDNDKYLQWWVTLKVTDILILLEWNLKCQKAQIWSGNYIQLCQYFFWFFYRHIFEK